MDPLNQPGSLGFAWVPLDHGAIDTPNVILTGGITEVTRTGDGQYAFSLLDPDSGPLITWPYGFAITLVTDGPLTSVIGGDAAGSSPTVLIHDLGGVGADPTVGFMLTILPI